MAKRKFELPAFEDSSKDQDRVLRLPENGQFLIVGGPGTGKSVVALLRARKYHDNNNYVFLTFNKVLVSFTSQLSDFRLKSYTLHSWFGKLYWQLMKEFVPEQEKYKPDYEKTIDKLKSLELKKRPLHIIIDEGQDMPVKFYEALSECGYRNFFIVADQNQQITEEHSSRTELTNFLGLDVEGVIELKENFRNTHPIALFSHFFYTDPSSPKPDLPPKMSLEIPTLYEYTNYSDCAKSILGEADRDNSNLIGVVVANDDLRDNYYSTLQSVEVKLDNQRIITTYTSKEKADVNINFGEGGIVVLNDKSIKGLEFDVVFIIVDGFKIYNNDIDSMKKRFYVMSSRAIEKLFLFKSISYNGGVEQMLPADENILKREVL